MAERYMLLVFQDLIAATTFVVRTVDSSATAAGLLLKQQSSMLSPAISTTPPADMAHPMMTCNRVQQRLP